MPASTQVLSCGRLFAKLVLAAAGFKIDSRGMAIFHLGLLGINSSQGQGQGSGSKIPVL